MKPKIIEKLLDKSSVVYTVQTTFPDSSRPETLEKFSTYYASAYVHKDEPTKLLINRHPELFENRDSCSFTEYDRALTLAKFLRLNGRLQCGWAHDSQEQYRKLRRGELKVRIVIESSRFTKHVVEG